MGKLGRSVHTRTGGFTLVELLVAIALLSLLMLGLGSSMRTISQTQGRVDVRLDRMDKERASIALLRSVLSQISGARRPSAQRKEGESEFFFDGVSQSMQWLGVMPARFGAGGRSHFRLAVEDNGGSRDLVLRFLPWVGEAVEPVWSGATSYVLERQVTEFSLSYQRARHSVSTWMPLWNVPKELPTAVQVQVRGAGAAWPLTVIELHMPLASSTEVGGRAVFGGSRR